MEFLVYVQNRRWLVEADDVFGQCLRMSVWIVPGANLDEAAEGGWR